MLKKISTFVVACLMATASLAAAETLVNGAGATFPYPLYSKWFSEYAKIDPSVKFNYQSIGSGGGIKQITAQTVDFGASDKFLSDAELKAAPGKLLHIPTVMGAVVVTYNLPGIAKGLKLNSEDVANIFLGKIINARISRTAAAKEEVSQRKIRSPSAPLRLATALPPSVTGMPVEAAGSFCCMVVTLRCAQ